MGRRFAVKRAFRDDPVRPKEVADDPEQGELNREDEKRRRDDE
jgi:hypothetical protein